MKTRRDDEDDYDEERKKQKVWRQQQNINQIIKIFVYLIYA